MAQSGLLLKPSLRALPSSLVSLGSSVTIRCQGPPHVDLYRLEKLGSGNYEDQDSLSIPIMRRDHAGCYHCSYLNGSLWSPPSDRLELIATGVYNKPSLSAHPSPSVSPGEDVTLQCQTQYGFDQFALSKEGDTRPYEVAKKSYLATFPITAVTAAHSGAYRCYSFSSKAPYLWSAPSEPLVLTVTGTSGIPGQLSIQPLSFITEASRNRIISATTDVSTTEMPTDLAASLEGSSPPLGPAHQDYTKGNLIRICLGVLILVLLAGFLAEDWYSQKKPLLHRVRAVQRPLPPLPRIPRSHGSQDGDGADVQKHRHHC
ncbi:platelet glycoprotein VI [Perognathus longimembris pacificus]|uniref:platelet glycoprotein VI n=1 Tax=Perognathus longimembris pacificus TaxID=214514 RepID=UPI0020191E7A|nr:platelet glycoprotein VI [Perognathus longimembris pacificus]